MLTSARAILPVYRTTPTAALHRESGLLPPELHLDARSIAATVRLRRLDTRHPLLRRSKKIISLQRSSSRFARRVVSIPNSEYIDQITCPPWKPLENQELAHSRVMGPSGISKELDKQTFLNSIQSIPKSDIVIYLDGSKQSDGSAGTGFVAYQGGLQVLRRCIALTKRVEVFDAEAIAALARLKAALELPTTKFVNNLWICQDNLEVAIRLLFPFSGSSEAVFDDFLFTSLKWKDRLRLPHIRAGEVKI